MTTGFTRRNNTERDIQPVAIHGVNPTARTCQVLTRVGTLIEVDCSYATGDTIVTPATGEQWYIERFDSVWRLYGRIPFNDPTLLIEPVEGQVSVGSGRGPVELNGDQVNINSIMKVGDLLYRSNNGQLEYSPDVDPPMWTVVSVGPSVDDEGYYILLGVDIDGDGYYDPRDLLASSSFTF